MIPQELIAEIGKLLREQPRNPTAIGIGEKLKAAIAATPVAVTAPAKPVAATDCIVCEARRARQRTKMQRYRSKA